MSNIEATMILLDNSDWSRNGDYEPSRWDAQYEAAHELVQQRVLSRPENTVGLITMAGRQVDVLLTPSVKEITRFKSALFGVTLRGSINFTNSLQIARLALKHRPMVNQKMRVIVFVASPIAEEEQALVNLAKTFRKENVAVDIINIGQLDEAHVQKLRRFHENVNNSDNSHFFSIAPSMETLVEQIRITPLLGNFGAAQENFAAQGNALDEQDEELQRIIRESEITAEQERQKRQLEKQQKMEVEQQQQQQQQQQEQPVLPPQATAPLVDQMNEDAEGPTAEQEMQDEFVRRAEEIAAQRTVSGNPEPQNQASSQPQQKEEAQLNDPDFIKGLLNDIEGLDQNNEELQKVLKQIGGNPEGGDKKNDKEGDKKQ